MVHTWAPVVDLWGFVPASVPRAATHAWMQELANTHPGGQGASTPDTEIKSRWRGKRLWPCLNLYEGLSAPALCIHAACVSYLRLQILQGGLVRYLHLSSTSQLCHIAPTQKRWATVRFPCCRSLQHLLLSVAIVSVIKIHGDVPGIQIEPHRQLEKTLTQRDNKG